MSAVHQIDWRAFGIIWLSSFFFFFSKVNLKQFTVSWAGQPASVLSWSLNKFSDGHWETVWFCVLQLCEILLTNKHSMCMQWVCLMHHKLVFPNDKYWYDILKGKTVVFSKNKKTLIQLLLNSSLQNVNHEAVQQRGRWKAKTVFYQKHSTCKEHQFSNCVGISLNSRLITKWRLSLPLASAETEAVICKEGLILGWMMKVHGA